MSKPERKFTAVRCPLHCLVCGALYQGGHALPGAKMKEGLRVFFGCGASMSVKALDGEFVKIVEYLTISPYQILFKNCCSEETNEQAP